MKLKYDELLSSFALNFKLRPSTAMEAECEELVGVCEAVAAERVKELEVRVAEMTAEAMTGPVADVAAVEAEAERRIAQIEAAAATATAAARAETDAKVAQGKSFLLTCRRMPCYSINKGLKHSR